MYQFSKNLMFHIMVQTVHAVQRRCLGQGHEKWVTKHCHALQTTHLMFAKDGPRRGAGAGRIRRCSREGCSPLGAALLFIMVWKKLSMKNNWVYPFSPLLLCHRHYRPQTLWSNSYLWAKWIKRLPEQIYSGIPLPTLHFRRSLYLEKSSLH